MVFSGTKNSGRQRERTADLRLEYLGSSVGFFISKLLLQNRPGVVHDKLLQKGSPLSLSGVPHTHLLGSKCPLPEGRCLSMPETGEKERNYLFKSYTDLE